MWIRNGLLNGLKWIVDRVVAMLDITSGFNKDKEAAMGRTGWVYNGGKDRYTGRQKMGVACARR